jgi:hypothetical protein
MASFVRFLRANGWAVSVPRVSMKKNRSSSETLIGTHARSSGLARRLDGSGSESKELVISTPDATGLGVDIARVLLSFGLSVVRVWDQHPECLSSERPLPRYVRPCLTQMYPRSTLERCIGLL